METGRMQSAVNKNERKIQTPGNNRTGTRCGKPRIFSTEIPHSSKWYWYIWQNNPLSDSKNCQISNLNFTICTQMPEQKEERLLKTRWKVWNSTRKTGFETGLFNFFHWLFNMWKNKALFTECIPDICGKLEPWAKRRKTAQNSSRPAMGRAAAVCMNSVWKLCRTKDKKRQFAGNESRLMLYFTLD
mgnify:FL=1